MKLAANLGPYNITGAIVLTHGNCLITGKNTVTDADQEAELLGTRGWNDGREDIPGQPGEWAPRPDGSGGYLASKVNVSTWRDGQSLFQLQTGASGLTFAFLKYHNLGTVFNSLDSGLANNTWRDSSFRNILELHETNRASTAVMTNYKFQRITGLGFSEGLIQWAGDSNGLLLEDVNVDSGYQTGDSFARMVVLTDTAHNLTVRRCSAVWCIEENGTNYWQGEGVSGERGNYNLTIEDCYFAHNGDTGMDIKSRNVTITRVTCEDNKLNFRIHPNEADTWTLTDCISLRPFKRGGSGGRGHIGIDGSYFGTANGGPIVLNNFTFKDDAASNYALFEVSDPDAAQPTTIQGHSCQIQNMTGGNQNMVGSGNIANTITAGQVLSTTTGMSVTWSAT